MAFRRYRGAKDSLGKVVNNIVTIMYGARWVLEILGDHSVKYRTV